MTEALYSYPTQSGSHAPLSEAHETVFSLVSKARILVVDDEHDLLELVRYNLAREGYRVSCVDSGEKALEEIRTKSPDLVILDIMLPGVDGLDVCRSVKSSPATAHVPILMLSAKSEDSDMVTGLELGADDYLTKPFSPRVLVARVKTILRKTQAVLPQNAVLTAGPISIFPAKHEARVAGNSTDLTATEFRILVALITRPGWVLSRDQIVDAARGTNVVVTLRSVDVHIVRLRQKLHPFGELIETVRGIGYRFRLPQA
jgi:two-component system alkaline phosphatase synthesis response regulator PhoP